MEEECESIRVYKWTFTLPENGQMNEHYVICWSWTLSSLFQQLVVREKHILFVMFLVKCARKLLFRENLWVVVFQLN